MTKKDIGMDDHGFTLVEVLIAMVILAIIVVPLLHVFISSANTNQKARKILRVTTASQDIMEGLKAYTIEDLAFQFNYPRAYTQFPDDVDATKDFHVIKKDLVNGGSDIDDHINEIKYDGSTYIDAVHGEAVTDKADVTASIYSNDYGKTYEFLGARDLTDLTKPDTGKYYFELTNVSLQDDRNVRFDALIELDATKYRTGGSATTEINSKEIVGVRTMNNVYDAFYVPTENDVNSAIQNMNAMFTPTDELKEKDIQRTITIDVDQTTVGTKKITKATIKIKYVAKGKGTGGTDLEYDALGVTGKQIFNNSSSEEELRNVYLFYYPIYNASSSGNTDVIVFNNNEALDLKFLLAKQEPASATSDLINKEANYTCRVDIHDVGVGSAADSKTKIQTNLDINLYDAYASTSAKYPASGNIKYYFNDAAVLNLEQLGVKSLAGRETKDRIYDITIKVYEAGAAAKGFPAKDLLTTLTGSKDN